MAIGQQRDGVGAPAVAQDEAADPARADRGTRAALGAAGARQGGPGDAADRVAAGRRAAGPGVRAATGPPGVLPLAALLLLVRARSSAGQRLTLRGVSAAARGHRHVAALVARRRRTSSTSSSTRPSTARAVGSGASSIATCPTPSSTSRRASGTTAASRGASAGSTSRSLSPPDDQRRRGQRPRRPPGVGRPDLQVGGDQPAHAAGERAVGPRLLGPLAHLLDGLLQPLPRHPGRLAEAHPDHRPDALLGRDAGHPALGQRRDPRAPGGAAAPG